MKKISLKLAFLLAGVIGLSFHLSSASASDNTDRLAAMEVGHLAKIPESATGGKPASIPETTFAFGVGIDRLPRWFGSAQNENRPVPYININWRDRVEFSTVNGLVVDFLHGERWHGGIVGTMMWGRSRKDLGNLDVPTLQNTLQGGAYLEYELTPAATLGMRLRHDIQDTGVAYADVYAELDLPALGYLEHDVRIAVEAMNQTGMRRFFGLSSQYAAPLGVSSYRPGSGISRTTLTYEGFMPTSESTGIAFAATVGRLGSKAADSPLVRDFGSSTQREFVAAFVYHF